MNAILLTPAAGTQSGARPPALSVLTGALRETSLHNASMLRAKRFLSHNSLTHWACGHAHTAMLRHFREEGFVVLRDLVAEIHLRRALAEVNGSATPSGHQIDSIVEGPLRRVAAELLNGAPTLKGWRVCHQVAPVLQDGEVAMVLPLQEVPETVLGMRLAVGTCIATNQALLRRFAPLAIGSRGVPLLVTEYGA